MENWSAITILSSEVGELLKQDNKTVATAESCTGGGIAMALTEIPGSSAYFTQSWVTYSNAAKVNLLNIPETILEQHGAVSESTVNAMAISALSQAETDYAIAVSGVAGPDGGTEAKPVGFVMFAFAQKDSDTLVIEKNFAGDRQSVRGQAIEFALQQLKEIVSSKK
ncbi:hypothetical protein C2869_05230 [Saccharobesus litoralis]|uniref:CinA C-terminal domain-containing protein n=1 Tax=Saccharobesus litoralis TaxID=2172099 RepID=A0A2S0VNU9_9ALTE|nr:nicotinamide-nucleotide amidohydrolase family protein [Saccharobesus litoralis]AWB65879.1 hypothetical protein C2869_05230 [Saccharobesus litoralis]